jgi:Glycosyl transferase family 2
LREQLGVEDLERRVVVLAQQLAHERDFLRAQLEDVHDRLARLQGELTTGLATTTAEQERLDDRLAELEHRQQVWSVMEYIRTADVEEKTLVSVVMATRNRAEYYLPRAIASVCAQSYPRWELLVVDDGSDDETSEVLGALEDDRIRCHRVDHTSLAAARNRALAEATGEIVTYLDDDNVLHPDWLRSVVWAFAECPEVDVLYGAMIIDDALRAQRLGAGGLPWLNFIRFLPERLAAGNVADIGSVAHRTPLPDAHFDESLDLLEDWDLLARLTRKKEPLALPVLAGIYTTSAPRRLMDRPESEVEAATRRLQSRLADER